MPKCAQVQRRGGVGMGTAGSHARGFLQARWLSVGTVLFLYRVTGVRGSVERHPTDEVSNSSRVGHTAYVRMRKICSAPILLVHEPILVELGIATGIDCNDGHRLRTR